MRISLRGLFPALLLAAVAVFLPQTASAQVTPAAATLTEMIDWSATLTILLGFVAGILVLCVGAHISIRGGLWSIMTFMSALFKRRTSNIG